MIYIVKEIIIASRFMRVTYKGITISRHYVKRIREVHWLAGYRSGPVAFMFIEGKCDVTTVLLLSFPVSSGVHGDGGSSTAQG